MLPNVEEIGDDSRLCRPFISSPWALTMKVRGGDRIVNAVMLLGAGGAATVTTRLSACDGYRETGPAGPAWNEVFTDSARGAVGSIPT